MPRAEPWASYVDLITAGQELEVAIHAGTAVDAYWSCRRASEQLRHAGDYLRDYGDLTLANEVYQASQQAYSLGVQALSLPAGQLKAYQSGMIYPFQGVIGDLAGRIRRLGGGF
jgi:hypothetical protein